MRHKMRPAAPLLRTLLVLAVSAVVAGVLSGVLSRGVMRVASLIDAASGVQGFTWDGSLRLIRDVVLLYSAPAALLFALARRVLPGAWLLKGILFGGLLFLVFLVAPAPSRDGAGQVPVRARLHRLRSHAGVSGHSFGGTSTTLDPAVLGATEWLVRRAVAGGMLPNPNQPHSRAPTGTSGSGDRACASAVPGSRL
jgi:hypothetical protein